MVDLSGSFWPNPAVQLSISGQQGGKVAHCHEGQEPTQSSRSALVKEAHIFIRKQTTLCKATVEVADMNLKLVSVRVKEVKGLPLTAILLPFNETLVA